MELPAIPAVILNAIQKIESLLDVPLLMHPPVVHFIISLPFIVLLLELINIIVKKRTIGVISFLLLLLTAVAAIAAYLTGNVDGKEAFPLLSEAVQGELKQHKLLGTYVMLASVVVVGFKLLSALVSRGLMKALYLLILIIFIVGILNQGQEGGKLVYKYGINVEKVQELDNELDDAKEELEEIEEANKAVEDSEETAIENTGVEVISSENNLSSTNNTPVIETTTEPKEELDTEVTPQAATD
ncbi:MAG: DUF2231 domain-containing protein [Campylobacterota bacterium]|nr:DUF2231 domain-containing protein [Campylobacterota bacterium]